MTTAPGLLACTSAQLQVCRISRAWLPCHVRAPVIVAARLLNPHPCPPVAPLQALCAFWAWQAPEAKPRSSASCSGTATSGSTLPRCSGDLRQGRQPLGTCGCGGGRAARPAPLDRAREHARHLLAAASGGAARWRMVGRVPASCLVPAYRVAVLSTACIARRNVALPASHRKSQNEESSETGRLQAS